jgi:primosomal protein N' (replication factor Y)
VDGPVVTKLALARVAVPVPLGQAFTYRVPEALAERVQRGARVLCQFGRRRVLGIVLDSGEREPDIAAERIKPLSGVVDAEPVLTEELLGFLQELARYYVAPIGEVMQLALPALERSAAHALGQAELPKSARVVGRLVQVARALAAASELPRLSPSARELWAELAEAGPAPLSELGKRWKNARALVKRLESAGLVALERREVSVDPFFAEAVAPDAAPELTEPQARAVRAICQKLEARERGAFLLEGVTASGKTEVYLRAVQRCLEIERGAIVLVPEIALTPQLVTRFRARLGDRIAVLHSALGERERHRMWKALRAGELRVAVGARSALFAPVQALGLVCIDEEHDGSFKQEEGVRYQARDMALLRAHRAGAVAMLGSATPSLESIALVRAGKLVRLSLPARARKTAILPQVETVDLRRVGPGPGGERLLSLPLFRALERTLAAKEQAILFLNRRGFAPSLLCGECGEICQCPNCSVALTLHRAAGGRLRCHYCEYVAEVPDRCQKCNASALAEEGTGTERIEAVLAELFPGARVARLDRDVAQGKKSARVLERMRRHEIDILVGTQMVTKGHDLPSVTLVGVLNADAALSMPDFRAAERSFQLLVQVAGRAGRGDVPGLVLIQTRQPEHPAVSCAARHDVAGFVELEMKQRAELGYPPFARLALVRVDSPDEAHGLAEALRLARLARSVASPEVEILGPAPAPLARLRNRFRFRFMARSESRTALRSVLLSVARAAPDRRTRVAIDVDPVNML